MSPVLQRVLGAAGAVAVGAAVNVGTSQFTSDRSVTLWVSGIALLVLGVAIQWWMASKSGGESQAIVPRTWRGTRDDVADRLADTVTAAVRARLGELGDRRPDELLVRWRTTDGATGDWPADLYRTAEHGRLVLLGEPGAGKSVFLDRLVRDLLRERGDSNAAVPVIVNLNAWTPASGTLIDWIVDRLTLDYPFVGRTLAAALLAGDRILPVLDGFDEIADDLQVDAWRGLNDVRRALVVASRPEEYRRAAAAEGPLASATVAELERLSPAETADYLGLDDGWPEALRQDPGELGRAMSTPLMASLARETYGRDLSAERISGLGNADAIERHLLAGFVPSRYRTEHRRGLRAHGPAWTSTLARAMPKNELAWWQLGESVPPAARVAAFAVPAAVLAMITDLLMQGVRGLPSVSALLVVAAAVIAVTRSPRPVRLQIGVAGRWKYAAALLGAGLVGGACVGGLSRPLVLEIGVWMLPLAAAAGTLPGSFLTWLVRRWELGGDAKTVWTELRLGAGGSLVGGAAIALIFGYFHVPDLTYPRWIGYGCAFGLAFTIPAAAEGDSRTDIATPRMLLRANRLWAIVQAAMVGVPFALLAASVVGPVRGALAGAAIGIAWGVASTAWGRWLILVRGWLPVRGRLPWRVWSWLEDAHDKQILRQAGAHFQFRHRRLHELLAGR